MRNSSPRVRHDQLAEVAHRTGETRPHEWPTLEVKVPDGKLGEPNGTKEQRYIADSLALREQLASAARSLMSQLRSLQERYSAEQCRLAETIDSLTLQQEDLDRELATVGRLAASLANGVSPTAPVANNDAESRRGSQLEQPPFDGLGVRCLGGFDVRYRGRPVDLGTSRNGRLLFKYLVTRTTKRASKEILTELFWPDVDLERGLTSLQTAVHKLKRGMAQSHPDFAATPAVVYADDHYALSAEIEFRCDVDTFRRRLAAARSYDSGGDGESACRAYLLGHEAYGGELLPEERYDDWVADDRRSLEAEYLAALARLVQLHLAREEHQQAVHVGQILLDVDATREDVHRDLMRAYSRMGRRSEAIRQYRCCFQTLQSELELLPEAETTKLFERLVIGETI